MLPRRAAVNLSLLLENFAQLDQPARLSLQRLLSDAEDLDRRCRAALLDPPTGSAADSTELY